MLKRSQPELTQRGGGDIDMFGHERGEKLTERKENLSHDVEKINEIKSSLCMISQEMQMSKQ